MLEFPLTCSRDAVGNISRMIIRIDPDFQTSSIVKYLQSCSEDPVIPFSFDHLKASEQGFYLFERAEYIRLGWPLKTWRFS